MDAHAKVCPKCGRTYETAASFCQKDGVRLQLLGEAPDAYIGQTLLDQFRIEEKIGAGGMGTVYRAEQTTLHRSVAIKILHPELASDPDAVRRFKREARVCTALDHANVVRVFLFGQLPDGSLYIVMEHLKGRSLLDVLSDEAALPVHRALHIVTQICDGVGEAHAHGVVHRDLKPENIVLVHKARDPDFVKVLDFGIARVLWGNDQTMATQTGLVFGTARYISPEGASGERTDARSDVYSLGVLAYQLLSGETPFDAPTPVAMLMKHIHASPPHLRSQPRATHVPVPVADVIMRALAKNPEGRYDDAHAFGDALRSAATRSGFEVKHRRAYSIAPGVHGVDPNVAPMQAPAPEPPPPSRRVPEPTPRMPSAPPPEPALTTDPIDAYDEVSIPGLRGSKPGGRTPWRGIGFAFAGGLALVLVAFGISRWMDAEDEVETPDFDTLAMEARAALGRGDYEGPAESSVEVLTDRIIEVRPDHREARRIRGEVARRLSDRAEAAAARSDTDDALRMYRRALEFAPEDSSIQEAIEALEAPSDPPPAPGVRTRPAYVIEGRELTLLAVPEPAMEVSRAEFVIERRGRAIGAAIAAEESAEGHGYEAQTTVARAGEYELVFRTGRGRGADEMRAPLTVHRDPDRPRPTREPDPPPITTQGSWSPSLPPAWNEGSQAAPAPEPARPEPARPQPASEFPAAPVIPTPTIPPWTGQ